VGRRPPAGAPRRRCASASAGWLSSRALAPPSDAGVVPAPCRRAQHDDERQRGGTASHPLTGMPGAAPPTRQHLQEAQQPDQPVEETLSDSKFCRLDELLQKASMYTEVGRRPARHCPQKHTRGPRPHGVMKSAWGLARLLLGRHRCRPCFLAHADHAAACCRPAPRRPARRAPTHQPPTGAVNTAPAAAAPAVPDGAAVGHPAEGVQAAVGRRGGVGRRGAGGRRAGGWGRGDEQGGRQAQGSAGRCVPRTPPHSCLAASARLHAQSHRTRALHLTADGGLCPQARASRSARPRRV